MKTLCTMLLALATAALAACGSDGADPEPAPPTPEPQDTTTVTPADTTTTTPEPEGYPEAPVLAFYKGADISWATEMEAAGRTFVNANGLTRECTALMKEAGMTSVRLRVWVNPTGGYCNKADVLVKARRAAALGMSIMIDFHYSDSWADPGQQLKPAAWRSLGYDDLVAAIADHTTDVLTALKDEGIDVRWVQVGNEVRSGMLWDTNAAVSGATWDATKDGVTYKTNQRNFVAFLAAGAKAVRAVYPAAKVVVHCDNGQKWDDVNWIAGLVRSVDYDVYGVSLYPDATAWSSDVDACVANLRRLVSTYKKDVMVVEVGMPVSPASTARQALTALLGGCRSVESCRGVFYWEPECPSSWNGYRLGAATQSGSTIRLTEAMQAFAD